MEYRIIKNEEHNGLEIYFDEKPTEEVRSALKEIKFRWHGVKKCWYGRAVALWARNKYDTYVNGYPFSICHGWQLKREEAPMFTEQFFDRWEAMTKIISSFNWNRSNSQADYFDVNFYESWEIKAA